MEHHNETQTGIIEEHLPPHHTEGGGSLLEIDGTIVFIAFSFIIFAATMQRVFYGPLTEIREKRKQYIDNLKKESDELLSRSEELNAQYTDKIKAARKKAVENTSSVMEEANQEKAKILEERSQQVSDFLETGRQQIKHEKAQSLENLIQKVESYSNDIFRKVMEEEAALVVGENNERNT